jgi:polysaccharide biosynthesis/export protein
MIQYIKFLFLITVVSLLLVSCVAKENIVYLQQHTSSATARSYEPVLQADDVLFILVSSENPEIAAPYNLRSVTLQTESEDQVIQQRQQTYLIDKHGNIEFPILGTIALAGLNKTEAVSKMKTLLQEHVKDAVVTIRLLNFKVSVLGEVTKPGSYTVKSERITILEALSLAGDMTIYGKRDNIMLVREVNGVTTINRIDLTQGDFMNSPYYFLSQNDVLYVEPNKTKINSSAVGPNLTLAISALSLIVTIIALTVK